jgi:uncharacterized protein
MSPEVARAAIDFALRDGGESPGIVFFGGEPLMKRDLIELAIAHARRVCAAAGPQVIPHFKITTNGLLLDDAMIDLCAREEVAVSLSIDGTPEAHDRHRLNLAGQPTWARVAERARALLERKPYSPAIMVATPHTVAHAAAGVERLFQIGFRYLIFQLDYSADWPPEALAELERQYRAMAELYLAMTRREEKFYLSPFDVKIATHIRGEEARGLLCKLGVRQVSVAPDGTLYPCVQFVPRRTAAGVQQKLGEQRDGRDKRFAVGDVWSGVDPDARAVCFEATERPPAECSGCAIEPRCNRRCGCLNLQTTGDLGAPSPLLCAHERLLVPIADRLGQILWEERAAMFVHKHYNKAFPMLSLIEDRAG